jgi:hypothetical protein
LTRKHAERLAELIVLRRISVIEAGQTLCQGAQKNRLGSGFLANDFAGTRPLE